MIEAADSIQPSQGPSLTEFGAILSRKGSVIPNKSPTVSPACSETGLILKQFYAEFLCLYMLFSQICLHNIGYSTLHVTLCFCNLINLKRALQVKCQCENAYVVSQLKYCAFVLFNTDEKKAHHFWIYFFNLGNCV